MQFVATDLAGVMVIDVSSQADERGLFARTFDAKLFSEAGLPTSWPQCNTSWNRQRGTLRGMHFQAEPAPEPKLVRCTRGSVFDVAVDLRRDSSTYCRWIGVELSADRRNALFMPSGIAHGFLTLEDSSEVFYQMGASYVGALARGVRWNDPAFSISWPFPPRLMSDRDANYQDFMK